MWGKPEQMAISSEQLVEIDAVLGTAAAGAEVRQALLARLPRMSVTEVQESEVDTVEPFRRYPAWLLFFIDQQHCRQIVSDPTQAVGLVVARRRGG